MMRHLIRPAVRLLAVALGISSDRFDRLWAKFASMSREQRKASIADAIDGALDRLDADGQSHT